MIKFIQPEFLPFCPEIFVISTKLSSMNSAEFIPIEKKSKPFSFFFAYRILSESLCSDILIIAFFGPALDFTQWQALILSG